MSDIRDCLLEDNPDRAFDCACKHIKTDKSDCRPRFVLLVEDGCPVCSEVKEKYSKAIKEKLVSVVSANDREGKDIRKKNKDLDLVPDLLLLDCNNKIIE